jgi:NAD(P)H dehydrogenase (quinone)
MSGKILVTGAGGGLGRKVVELLLSRHQSDGIVAVTRKPESLADLSARGVDVRRGDFDDEQSLPGAFAGVERALVVSTDVLDKPGHRALQHTRAFRALATAGAKHVAYTSIINPINSRIQISKDHADSEAALAHSGVSYTVLRNNIYCHMLFQSLGRAVATGKLVDARGKGRVGYVTRDDIAAVAAAVLVEAPSGNQILNVTGPQSLDGDDIATLVSEISGREVEHVSVPLAALIDGMVQHGLPRPLAELFASFDTGIAAGELDVTSDVVQRFAGHAPQSLADFLRQNQAAWAS